MVVLATGRRSERFAQAVLTDLPDECFVQIGDYFRFAMEAAASLAFSTVVLAVFFGKALKMAQGIPHTHAAKSRLVLDWLAAWTQTATGNQRLAATVRNANTARQAFEILKTRQTHVLPLVAAKMIQAAAGFAGKPITVRSILFDYDGQVAHDSGVVDRKGEHA